MNLSMFPLILIIGLLMFGVTLLSDRKQKRHAQEQQQLQQDLNEGDVVMTIAGMRAIVVEASYEETIDLEIAPGVVTTWQRSAIREKVNPTQETDDAENAPESENSEDAVATSSAATVSESESADSEVADNSRSEATPVEDTAGARSKP